MYQSPLKDAHRLVMTRLLEYRREAAEAASSVRGDGIDRHVPGTLEPDTVPWGVVGDGVTPTCEIILDFGELEAEYAALRRASAIFDRPDRAVIEIAGGDAEDLLERLVTNAFVGVAADVVRAFLLARNGRIIGDLVLIRREGGVLVELDRSDAARVVETLGGFVFSEDVEIIDHAEDRHRMDLLGPESPAIIDALCGDTPRGGKAVDLRIGESPVTVFALDSGTGSPVGEPGFGLIVARADAIAVWERILETTPSGRRPVRAIGWNACNIARLEAGTPLFHLDFGPDALPHETGLIEERVSFKKGCYPGQEIVARMQSRGRSKRKVVGFRGTTDALPVAGAQVFDAAEGVSTQIGVVTGSTVAPMRGATVIGLASLRSSHASAGTPVLVSAEGEVVSAVVTGFDFEIPDEGDREGEASE